MTSGHLNDIAVGPDGNLWFTDAGQNEIGRITTAGAITKFPRPDGGQRRPRNHRRPRRQPLVHREPRQQARAHHHRRRGHRAGLHPDRGQRPDQHHRRRRRQAVADRDQLRQDRQRADALGEARWRLAAHRDLRAVIATSSRPTALVFLSALAGDFVAWDDDINFTGNPHFRGLGWSQIQWAFTTFHLGVYQPLAWLALELQFVVGGLSPAMYHVVSWLLHALNAALVYRLIAALLARADAPRRRRRGRPAAEGADRGGGGRGLAVGAAPAARGGGGVGVMSAVPAGTTFALLATMAHLSPRVAHGAAPGRRGRGSPACCSTWPRCCRRRRPSRCRWRGWCWTSTRFGGWEAPPAGRRTARVASRVGREAPVRRRRGRRVDRGGRRPRAGPSTGRPGDAGMGPRWRTPPRPSGSTWARRWRRGRSRRITRARPISRAGSPRRAAAAAALAVIAVTAVARVRGRVVFPPCARRGSCTSCSCSRTPAWCASAASWARIATRICRRWRSPPPSRAAWRWLARGATAGPRRRALVPSVAAPRWSCAVLPSARPTSGTMTESLWSFTYERSGATSGHVANNWGAVLIGQRRYVEAVGGAVARRRAVAAQRKGVSQPGHRAERDREPIPQPPPPWRKRHACASRRPSDRTRDRDGLAPPEPDVRTCTSTSDGGI